MKVTLSALARLDWLAIGRFGGARWSVAVARDYAGQLRAALRTLGDFPHSGPPHVTREGRVTGYRRKSVGSHVIFYRVTDESVEIGRILHASQDADRHLS